MLSLWLVCMVFYYSGDLLVVCFGIDCLVVYVVVLFVCSLLFGFDFVCFACDFYWCFGLVLVVAVWWFLYCGVRLFYWRG